MESRGVLYLNMFGAKVQTDNFVVGGVVGRNLGVVRNCTEGVSGEIEGIVGETVGTVTKVNAWTPQTSKL